MNENKEVRSDVFSMLMENKDIFGYRRVMIPTPRFVVFYNGKQKRPAVENLKLSDAFEKKTEMPELELTCTVYNINSGYNNEFLEKCKVINGYTTFIEKVRLFDELNVEQPIKQAIEWCIENNILRDFFETRGQEVLKAMTIDMTWEHREELIRRDERQEGAREQYEKDQKIIDEKIAIINKLTNLLVDNGIDPKFRTVALAIAV